MRPRHRKKRELHKHHMRPQDPIAVERQRINRRLPAEQQTAHPHNSEMASEPERNAQAEQELRDFDARIAKVPALIQRPQAQRKMRYGGYVEREIHDRNSPPPDMQRQPPFHGRVRNIAERVIEEMREDVREHHQAAGDAHLPHADAAQPSPEPACRLRSRSGARQ
jgi:hypothetical protein